MLRLSLAPIVAISILSLMACSDSGNKQETPPPATDQSTPPATTTPPATDQTQPPATQPAPAQ